jgi:hypothetical protein
LLVDKGRAARWTPVFIGLAIVILVLPWYVNLPASLTAWRVSGHWLYDPVFGYEIQKRVWPWRTASIHLLWSFFTIAGTWLGSKRIDHLGAVWVVAVVVVACVRRPREILNRRTALLWVWMTAAILAPITFDVLRKSFASITDRYVLAGLPAAFTLFAICLLEMPRGPGIIAGLAIVMIWAIGDRRVFLNPSRDSEPYRNVALRIDRESPHPDLLVLHAIPSGILGIARYLRSDIPLFSWVGQLHVRWVPDDIAQAAAGTHKVILVKIHQLGEPAPEDVWLKGHASGTRTAEDENAEIEVFEIAPAARGSGCRHALPPPEGS